MGRNKYEKKYIEEARKEIRQNRSVEVDYLTDDRRGIGDSEAKYAMKGEGELKKYRVKEKIKKFFRGSAFQKIVTLVALVVFAVSSYKLIDYFAQESRNTAFYKEIKEIVNIKPPDRGSMVNPGGDIEIPVEPDPDSGVKIIKYDTLTDWKKLQDINPDCVGWISILAYDDSENNIEYPLLQGVTNDTYLYANLRKEYNSAGSIFVEQYNQPLEYNRNTTIYGHNMNNGSMFGQLYKYKDEDYFNKHNLVVTLNEKYYCVWKIFSYHTPHMDYQYREFSFPTEVDGKEYSFVEYAELLSSLSQYNVETEFDGNDRILTLSTCKGARGTTQRTALHAKLIDVAYIDYGDGVDLSVLENPYDLSAPDNIMNYEARYAAIDPKAYDSNTNELLPVTAYKDVNRKIESGDMFEKDTIVQVACVYDKHNLAGIVHNGKIVWVKASELDVLEPGVVPNSYAHVINAESADVYTEPLEDAEVYFSLETGSKVQILSIEEGWTEIEAEDGKKGFIRSQDISEPVSYELVKVTKAMVNAALENVQIPARVIEEPEPPATFDWPTVPTFHIPTPTPPPTPSQAPSPSVPSESESPAVEPSEEPQAPSPSKTPPPASAEVKPSPSPEKPPETPSPPKSPTPSPSTETPSPSPTPSLETPSSEPSPPETTTPSEQPTEPVGTPDESQSGDT